MKKRLFLFIALVITIIAFDVINYKYIHLHFSNLLAFEAIVLSIFAMFSSYFENAESYKTELSIEDVIINGEKTNLPYEFYDVDFIINITNIGEKVAKEIQLCFDFDLESFSKNTNNLNLMYDIEEKNGIKYLTYSIEGGTGYSLVENNYKINHIFGNKTIAYRLPPYISDLICMYLKSYDDNHKWQKFPIIKLQCKYKDYNDVSRTRNFELKFNWDSKSKTNFRGMINVNSINN